MSAQDPGSQPLVTVLVVCYNHSRFVVEALDSVRRQNYPNLQLIVADDCSRDDSVEVIRAWISKHWPAAPFLAHAKNVGLSRTLNEMLELAEGKYVCCLAADDTWVDDRLAVQVPAMEALPDEVGVLYSDAYQIDENGQKLPKMFIEAHRRLSAMPEGWIFDTLAEGNFIPAMATMIRRQCFAKVGNYDADLAIEDWDMWLRIARQFQFRFSPHITANYRVLSTSITRSQPHRMNRDTIRIWLKCASLGWLNPEPEKLQGWVAYLQYADALMDYLGSRPQRFRTTFALVRQRPNLRNLLLFGLCYICMPPRYFDSAVKAINRRSKSARSR